MTAAEMAQLADLSGMTLEGIIRPELLRRAKPELPNAIKVGVQIDVIRALRLVYELVEAAVEDEAGRHRERNGFQPRAVLSRRQS